MRKIFSLIAAVLFAGSMMAQVTIDYANAGYDNNTPLDGVAVAQDGVTITLAKGSGTTAPAYYSTGTGARTYGGNTITVDAGTATITNITFDFSQNNKDYTVNEGTYTKANSEWTGSASSVLFTTESGSGHNRIKSITVTLAGSTPVAEYYLVGNFNGWQADEAYKLVKNPGNAAEMMIKGVELAAEDSLKVIGILGETTTWYPDNADNYVVAADGEYDIYFRADGQGGDDWYYHYFYLAQVLVPTTCAEASAAILALADNTYLLDQRQITLRGYVTEIAADYSEDYHNVSFWMADEANGGQVIEAFRATCATAEDAPAVGDVVEVTGKMKKYVKNNVATPEFDAGCTFTILDDIHTAIENTNAAVKATKVVRNGQLFIEKNGVIYNAQGAVVR